MIPSNGQDMFNRMLRGIIACLKNPLNTSQQHTDDDDEDAPPSRSFRRGRLLEYRRWRSKEASAAAAVVQNSSRARHFRSLEQKAPSFQHSCENTNKQMLLLLLPQLLLVEKVECAISVDHGKIWKSDATRWEIEIETTRCQYGVG